LGIWASEMADAFPERTHGGFGGLGRNSNLNKNNQMPGSNLNKRKRRKEKHELNFWGDRRGKVASQSVGPEGGAMRRHRGGRGLNHSETDIKGVNSCPVKNESLVKGEGTTGAKDITNADNTTKHGHKNVGKQGWTKRRRRMNPATAGEKKI